MVDEFVRLSIKNGIDVIRIFDALNDPRNLETAVKATKKYNGICEVAISYTQQPRAHGRIFREPGPGVRKDGRG